MKEGGPGRSEQAGVFGLPASGRLLAGRPAPNGPVSAFLCCSLCPSAALYMQVELQFRGAEALNLTLWGLSNHNALHLHPLEEEEVDKGWNGKEAGRETKAFYCCYPGPMSSTSATQGLCLLWLSNQTALRGAARSQLLWAETGRR